MKRLEYNDNGVSDEAVIAVRSGFGGTITGLISAREPVGMVMAVGGGVVLGSLTYGFLRVKKEIGLSRPGIRQIGGGERRRWLERQRDRSVARR